MPWFEHRDTFKLAKVVLDQLAHDAEAPCRQRIGELQEIRREIDGEIASLDLELRNEGETARRKFGQDIGCDD
jgi:hypothetical protein